MQHATQESVDLRHYLQFVWRRKVSIAVTVVIAVALGLFYTRLQDVQYTSTAEVLLRPRASEVVIDTGSQTDPKTATATEVQVVQSATVSDAVAKKLGAPAAVTVAQVADTDVITISATAADAASAQHIAQTWAETYIEVRKQQTIADLQTSAAQLQKQMDEIDAQVAALQGAVDALTNQIAAATTTDEKVALTAQRDLLSRQNAGQITTLTDRKTSYANELDQRNVAIATTSGGAQLISDAPTAAQESGRTPAKNALLGLAAGLVLGLGIAFVREQLDDRIRGRNDLDSLVARAPLLGVIPLARRRRKDRKTPALVTKLSSAPSASAEAYNGLRTALQFALSEEDLKMLQVTSAGRYDGKSTIAANIATGFAQTGLRVVLADCDLRQPRLHAMFDVANDVGLSAVIRGDSPITDAARPIAEEPDLLLLVAGQVPPNPSELVSTDRARRLLSGIRRDAEIAILDSPSLPVADSVALAARADGVLLVVRAGHTSRRDVTNAIELLDQVNAKVIGIVLTDERRIRLRADHYDVYAAPTGWRRLLFWRRKRGPAAADQGRNGLMSSAARVTSESENLVDSPIGNGKTTDPVEISQH